MGTICSAEDDFIPVDKPQKAANINSANIYDLANRVNVFMKAQHNPIELNSTMSQTIPIQLKIDVGEIASNEKAPIDIILVLDHSGSMAGERMELAKDACYDVLQYLGPQDRVGLIKFDCKATEVTHISTMTEQHKAKLVRDIRSIEAEGGTDIAAGLKLAIKMLHKRKYVNAVTSIFLLSDGEDEGADERVRNLIASYDFDDVYTINTFGFSHHHDPELMSAIAHEKGGNFYFIEEINTIDECFADCLGGLVSVVADNVNVVVQSYGSDLLPGLRICQSYGLPGDWIQTGNVYKRTIPHLMSGREMNSIFEVRIPACNTLIQEGFTQLKIASAQITLQGLNYDNSQKASVVKNVDLIVTFTNPGVQVQQRTVDADVMFNYFRVRKATILNMAHLACSRGQFGEAKAMLQSLIQEMKQSVLATSKVGDFDDLIKDFEAAFNHIQYYHRGGKHHLLQHHRNHMDERSNIHSNVIYGNAIQASMVQAARNKKMPYRY